MILYSNREPGEELEIGKFHELTTATEAVRHELDVVSNEPEASLHDVARLSQLETKLRGDLSTSFGTEGYGNFETRTYKGEEAKFVLRSLYRHANSDVKPKHDGEYQSWFPANAKLLLSDIEIQFDTGDIPRATEPAQSREPKHLADSNKR